MISCSELWNETGRNIRVKATIGNKEIKGDGITEFIRDIKVTHRMENPAGISLGSALGSFMTCTIHTTDDLMGKDITLYVGIVTGQAETIIETPGASESSKETYTSSYEDETLYIVDAEGKRTGETIVDSDAIFNYEDVSDGSTTDGLTTITYTDVIEYICLGTFTITDIKASGENVVVTAFDKMYSLDVNYLPQISMPNTPANIMSDIASQFGISVQSAVFPNIQVDARGYKVKDVVGYIAGLIKCNCFFNRSNILTFKWYSNTSVFTVKRSAEYMGETNKVLSTDRNIGGVSCNINGNIISVGTNAIEISNPFMTNAVLNTFSINYTYKPFEINHIGNPGLEVGDSISVEVDDEGTTYFGAIQCMTTTISGGMSQKIYCYDSKTQRFLNFESPSTKRIKLAYETLNNALLQFKDIFTSSDGVFEITEKNGVSTGWKIHDSDDESNYVVANNYGLGFVKDNVLTQAITHEGIVADAITVGKLSSERLSVGDASLGECFDVSQDEDGRLVVSLSAGDSNVILKQFNDKISFYNKDGDELAYFSDDAFRIVNPKLFIFGNLGLFEIDNPKEGMSAEKIYIFNKIGTT